MRKHIYKLRNKVSPFIFFCFILSSCRLFSPSVSAFDQYSYTQTTSLKVDALDLMDLATDSVQLHEKEIKTVQSAIQKIVEYEKHRPKNEVTTQLWFALTDTSGNLFGKFILRWQHDKILKPVYVQEKKKQIGLAFDQIAEMESGKNKLQEK